MLGIKIYDSSNNPIYLDLQPGTTLSYEKISPAFDNDLQGADFSLPIEIPFTDHNKKSLGFIENFSTLPITKPEYWRCDVYDGSIAILQDAKLKLVSTKGRFDYKQGFYSFSISGTKGLFGTLIKNKSLKKLNFGGKIIWDSSLDSRQFAKELTIGNFPQHENKISFAPLYCGDYFDTSRKDYLNEFIHNQIVNNIIVSTSFTNGWTFARPNDSNPLLAIAKGAPTYEDYRTIPFIKLTFLIKQIFSEHGFTALGSFFGIPDIEKLVVFNNYSIEKYDYPFTFDLNNEIDLSNHVPDILIADFLISLQNFFNLKISFIDNLNVSIDLKENSLSIISIKDFTKFVSPNFDNAELHESNLGGYSLKMEFDSDDSYKSDKVKEVKKLNIIAEVNIFSDISTLTFLFTLDTTHFIYVKSENYYYNYNGTEWEPYSEWLNDIEVGKNTTQFTTQMSPLCQHYILGNTSNILEAQNMCAVRMPGSYYNAAKERVANPFGLRIFFADISTSAGITDMPYSFSHNYDTNGNKIASFSINWNSIDGIYNKFWRKWISMLVNAILVKTKMSLKAINIQTLNENDTIQLKNSYYLVKSMSINSPLNSPSDIELVKL